MSHVKPFLTELNTNFGVIVTQSLDSTANRVPLKFGLYFGECASLCGSLGITAVNGLNALGLSYNESVDYGATVFYTTCGLTDAAVIRVPIQSILDMTVMLRATGQNQIWPSEPEHTAGAMLMGEIVLTIPVDNKTLRYTQLSASVHFTGNWQAYMSDPAHDPSWPETTNPLFERVPISSLIDDYAKALNTTLAKNIEQQIRTLMFQPDAPLECKFPALTKMICTAEMAAGGTSPPSACHPCDTCCKCFAQQRCDSDCDQCPCINCLKTTWRFGQFAISILILVFSAALLYQCYKLQFLQ